MSPTLKWILIALAALGLAGVVYWLLSPVKSKTTTSSTGTSAMGFLSSLLGGSGSTTGGSDGFDAPVDGTDRGGGVYGETPNWPVFDYGAESGTDFEGRQFVRSSAPMFQFEAKIRPYRYGVDYDFEEQTAKGVALLKRFPEFTLTDVKIHLMGPWYSDANANSHFSRGVTTISGQPTFRQGPTTILSLPATRKSVMLYDPFFRGLAKQLLTSKADADPAMVTAWQELSENSYLDLNKDAYVELGKAAWHQERYVTDENGQGYRWLSVDIEVSTPVDNYRHATGWIYEGYISEAAASGVTVRPFLYYGPQQTTIFGLSNTGANGIPEYLSDRWDFLSNQDPTVVAVQRFGGVVANDTYLQGIWGNEPFLQRDGEGTPLLSGDGQPRFSNQTTTLVYGQTIYLENGEAELCLRDIYEQSIRLYLINHRIAGGYPSVGGARKPGFEQCHTGSFTRYTNEGLQGITQNDRPVPAWQMELFNFLNIFLTQHLWAWGQEFNHMPDVLGADHTEMWEYCAHGVVESLVKAGHRKSAFAPIQNSPFKWCWFNLSVINSMNSSGDGYHEKALLHAKIRNVNGSVWLEVLFAFPASDNRSTPYQVVVEQNGQTSEIYLCEQLSGRHLYYDCWLLPAFFSYDQLEGANVLVSYPDVLGVQRTYRGDYRVNVNVSN